MSSPPPKTKGKPKLSPDKKERRTDASDPALKQTTVKKLPPAMQPSNDLVPVPIEISVSTEHALNKPNIGWSRRARGQNVERAIKLMLNPANQLTASAIIRNDVFMLRWLAALLLAEFMAVQWRHNQVVRWLQIQLVGDAFKTHHKIPGFLLFSPLAFELTRSGFFDSLKLRVEGEVAFFTVNVSVPKAALAELWLWKNPIDLAKTPRLEKPVTGKV